MKTAAQRAAKRAARESRKTKEGTWYCSGCQQRHPKNERCPIPRREPPTIIDPGLDGGMGLMAIAAMSAARKK